MANQERLGQLKQVVENILETNFKKSKDNIKLIQTFKNDVSSFPWDKLETDISEQLFKMAADGIRISESDDLVHDVEFNLFCDYVKHHNIDLLLSQASNFDFVESND